MGPEKNAVPGIAWTGAEARSCRTGEGVEPDWHGHLAGLSRTGQSTDVRGTHRSLVPNWSWGVPRAEAEPESNGHGAGMTDPDAGVPRWGQDTDLTDLLTEQVTPPSERLEDNPEICNRVNHQERCCIRTE